MIETQGNPWGLTWQQDTERAVRLRPTQCSILLLIVIVGPIAFRACEHRSVPDGKGGLSSSGTVALIV